MGRALKHSLQSIRRPCLRRAYHCRQAAFTTLNKHKHASPATEQVEVWLGEPHEAYVMIPKHVGRSIEAACAPHGESHLAAGPGTYPLFFDHINWHFTHGASPFPRLAIPQNLPRQSSASVSPATLFVCGATDVITLNRTSDFDFVRRSEESYRRLKQSLDNLRDR